MHEQIPWCVICKIQSIPGCENDMTKCICFLKSLLYLDLTSTSLHLLSSTDKGQNSSSGLKITVNIPSNSLDAWLYPDFPQLHTRAQPAPSAHEFSPAVAKAISTGQNTQGLESARCALKQANHPQGKPMD